MPHAVAEPPDAAHEARLAALLHAWWREERPAWTEESWWAATLHDDVRRLLWLAPGPHLATALADVTLGGPCSVPHLDDRMGPGWPTPGHQDGWPCACQVVTAAAWEACASWVAARCAAALATAAGSHPVEFDVGDGRQRIHDPAREELAHALRTSIPAMGNRIAAARALTAHPRLGLLVESGAISAWAGRLVLEHLSDLEEVDAGRVIDEVAQRVHHRLTTGRRPYHSAEINRLARAARLRICPETVQESRVRAFSTRRVIIHPGNNGMSTLIAELADVDAHRIHRRLTAIAAGVQADAAADGSHEPRTRDQLRADILTDLLVGTPQPATITPEPPAGAPGRGAAVPGSPGHDGAPRPAASGVPDAARGIADAAPGVRDASSGVPHAEIQVIVTLDALLGLAEDPAEVPGVGPIPAEVARELAADGRWRAWITNAAGVVTATGTQSYVPSASLARLVRAREPHCRFPGCRQPATRCDLDHAVPWPHGATTAANLGPLCRRHHNLKTHMPWDLDPTVESNADPRSHPSSHPSSTDPHGSASGWRWHTPAGFTIIDRPDPPLGPGDS